MQIVSRYTEDPDLREKLCQLTNTVFPGSDFGLAYSVGGWGKIYHPYSIMEDGKFVANVAISELEVILEGRRIPTIQFATVSTLPEYRKRGYSRFLMETIIAEYESKTEFMFLYANPSVLEFYPRFGFERLYEWKFNAPVAGVAARPDFRKLDIFNPEDHPIIYRLSETRLPITEVFGATNYGFALLFHVANNMQDSLHYLEDLDILVVAEQEGPVLNIYDVLSTKPFSFREILPRILPDASVQELIFHFTPELLDIATAPKEMILDDEFFVRGAFPIQEEKYKFPAMGQT